MAHSNTAAVGLVSLLNSLFEAAILGNVKSFDKAIKAIGKAADLREVKDDAGRSALHYAALGGSRELCTRLVEQYKLDPNARDRGGATPLALAVGNGALAAMEALLALGANANAARQQDGVGPMHRAATAPKDGPAVMERLVEAGVELDAPSTSGTPLCLAAHAGRPDNLQWLISHGAHPHAKTASGVPSIMLAVASGSVDCLKALLAAGASATAASEGSMTALHVAATLKDEDVATSMAQELLQAGADANAADSDGTTPILIAAARQSTRLLEQLLPHTTPIPDVEWTAEGLIAHAEASGLRQKVLAGGPGGPESSEKGSGGPKEVVIEQAEEPDEEAAQELKAEADAAFRSGDAAQAHDLYTRSLRHDTSSHLVWANRSAAALKLGKHEEALEDARKSAALQPDYAKAWYRLGAAHAAMESWEDAALAFYEAQGRDPDNEHIKEEFHRAIREGRKQHQQRQQQQQQQQQRQEKEKEKEQESAQEQGQQRQEGLEEEGAAQQQQQKQPEADQGAKLQQHKQQGQPKQKGATKQ